MPNFFALSISLQVGIVAAFAAMAVTLRRPGARLWTAFWTMRMLTATLTAATFGETASRALAQPRLWATAVALASALTLFLLLLAGWRQFTPDQPWNPAWWVALLFLLPYLFIGLTVPSGPATAGGMGWYVLYARVGPLPIDGLLLAVTIAFRRRTDRAAATFLGIGFLTAVLRDVASAIYIMPRLGTPAVVASPPFLSIVQLLSMVALALGGLFAVLADERDAMGRLANEVERARLY
jgi:hypothetical protein